MPLTNEEKKRFRQIGHDLKPVVMVGQNGVTENVLEEVDSFLEKHELIKVKFLTESREQKKAEIEAIVKKSKSQLVQQIGKIALLYRLSKEENNKLSKIR